MTVYRPLPVSTFDNGNRGNSTRSGSHKWPKIAFTVFSTLELLTFLAANFFLFHWLTTDQFTSFVSLPQKDLAADDRMVWHRPSLWIALAAARLLLLSATSLLIYSSYVSVESPSSFKIFSYLLIKSIFVFVGVCELVVFIAVLVCRSSNVVTAATDDGLYNMPGKIVFLRLVLGPTCLTGSLIEACLWNVVYRNEKQKKKNFSTWYDWRRMRHWSP